MGLESQIPDIVVRPKYTEEIRKILIYCTAEKIAVSPVSGGLSGGFACPTIKPAGVMLDLGRMDRIIEIRDLYFTTEITQKKISELYNVKEPCIYKIVNYKTWKYL